MNAGSAPLTPQARTPGDAQIRALHERYAPTVEAFELVHTHCQIVARIAEQLLQRAPGELDAALVRAGALLHDIGVYLLYDDTGRLDRQHYLRHGVLGHQLLDRLGFPEELARFCSCHTGAGLTREDVVRQQLPIPVADYLPRSAEEELVMYADKFHRKTSPPVFVGADSCAVALARFGADTAARFTQLRHRFGDPDLAPLSDRHGHGLT